MNQPRDDDDDRDPAATATLRLRMSSERDPAFPWLVLSATVAAFLIYARVLGRFLGNGNGNSDP